MNFDNETDYAIVYRSPGLSLLGENQVRVTFSHAYDRKPANASLEECIENNWAKVCAENHYLYNAQKFRYGGHTQEDKTLKLLLGVTDYKTFIGTNASAEASLFIERGLSHFQDANAHLANPLGVGALVHTADDMFVFIKRSEHVGEAKGMTGIPGGHPEPKRLLDAGVPGLDSVDSGLIVDEIFRSILLEIQDEINVPRDTLSSPVLIGIVGSPRTANRPTVEFYTRCALFSAAVRALYERGDQQEAFESSAILFLSSQQLRDVTTHPLYSNLTPSAKGAIAIYNHLRTT